MPLPRGAGHLAEGGGGGGGDRNRERDARATDARATNTRDVLSRYGERFLSLVHAAALTAGYKRLCVLRGGCSLDVVKSWFKPSRGLVMPADVLCELLWREDVLEEGPRGGLLRALCEEAGYAAVPLPYGGGEIDAAVLAAVADLGELAAALSTGERDGTLDAAELERIGRESAELAAGALRVQAIAAARMRGLGSDGVTQGRSNAAKNGTGAAARR
jgi:hypothetical protein